MVMAFDYAWAKAQEAGDADAMAAFLSCARSVRVKFTLLTDQVDFEMKKWDRACCSHSRVICRGGFAGLYP